jgi:autotransporter-associated beta strand protein
MNSQINRLVGAATTENGTSIEISLENNVTPVGPHTSGRMIGAFASSFGTNEGDAAFFTNSANSASRWNEGLHIEDVSTIGIHLGSPITSSSALPLPVLGMQFDPRDVATSGGSFNSPRIRLNISAWNGSSADTRNAEIEAIALTGPTRAALRWLLDATEVIRADDTEFVVNDGGLSTVDFRVESDNQTNMLFVDASADTLLVSGASTFSAGVVLSGGVLEYNDAPTLAASTTPSVTGGNVFLTNSTASITDFTGEQNGQVITLLCEADTTTSLVDSTPLFLAGAFTCTADDTISLISNGTVWYETSRSVN